MAINGLAYERESDDKEKKGRRVTEQRALIDKTAPEHGYTVVRHYDDPSRSAAKVDANRPGFDALCAALEAGPVNVVLVTEVTRLTREDSVAGNFIKMMRRIEGKVVKLPEGRVYNLTDYEDRKAFRKETQGAIDESDKISYRVRQAHERGREARKYMGGPSPFGWRREPYMDTSGPKPIIKTRWLIDEVEGPEVKSWFEAILRGESIFSIAARLNAEGVKPRLGKVWGHSTIHNILRNPRACGMYGRKDSSGKWQTYTQPEGQEYQFAAIVDFATWKKVNAILDRVQESRSTASRKDAVDPLAGLFRCDACGQNVVSMRGIRPNGREKKPILRHVNKGSSSPCLADHKLTLSYPETLEYVGDLVDRYILSAPLRRRPKVSRDFDAELADVVRRLEELTDQVGVTISYELGGRKEKKLLAEHAEIIEQRARVQEDEIPVFNLASAVMWRTMPVPEMRRVIFGIFDHIEVRPGLQRYDPFDRTRFTPVFRDLDDGLNDLLVGRAPGWDVVAQWLRQMKDEPDAPRDEAGALQLSDRFVTHLLDVAQHLEKSGIDPFSDPTWSRDILLRSGFLNPYTSQ